MSTPISKSLFLAIAALGIAGAAQAQIESKGSIGYVIDQRGYVATSGHGLCWRTGFWTPALAIAACDPDLVKPAEAPKAPVAAPAPAPAPVAAPAPAPAAAPAPAPAPKPAAQKVTLAADDLFDFGSDKLRPKGMQSLDGLAGQLKDMKVELIIVTGHTDRIGSDKANQALSERRAASVKNYLAGKGVEPNRIYTEGKGKRQPVTGGKCGTSTVKTKKLVDCLQPDRRVEIEVTGSKAQ